jgi:DNA adenine methylase
LLNQKDKVYDKDIVLWWKEALQKTTILSGDWKESTSNIQDLPDSFVFLDPPYRGSFTSYGQEFTDDDQKNLVEFTKKFEHTKVFLCNRDIEDNFYEDILGDLLINKYPVTYTAGRRKKTEDGFEAKKATEVLIRNL